MGRDEAIARLRASAERVHGFGVPSLYLFGSVARNEATGASDVDVFVDPDYEQFDFVALIRLEEWLAEQLGCPVDLTTREGLHPVLRPAIEREAIHVL
ncbi:nucleotidyltransferase family protein [Methylobacterium sp. JK268]